MDAFGLFTGQVGYAWNNVLLYAKGGAAVTDRNYDFVTAVARWFPRPATTPAGAHRRCWPRIRLLPELVGRHEYDHIFEDRHDATFITPAGGRLSATRRVATPTWSRPPELPLGWPGHREVLRPNTEMDFSLSADLCEKAGLVPAFFIAR